MHTGTCLLCLAVDRRTLDIARSQLLPVYEKITDFKIKSDSHRLCFICHTRLQHCYQLRQLAKRTQHLLISFTTNKLEKSVDTHKSLVELSRYCVADVDVAPAPGEEWGRGDECVKEEAAEDVEVQYDNTVSLHQLATVAEVSSAISKSVLPHSDKVETRKTRKLRQTDIVTLSVKDDISRLVPGPSNSVSFNVSDASENDQTDGRNAATALDGRELYRCRHCPFKSVRHESLQRHERGHAATRRYICAHCGRHFPHKGNYARHLRTHTGDRPYVCDACPAAFAQLSTLNAHRRVHTGERPFTCGECGARFGRRAVLRRHEVMHTGIKPHRCDQCDSRFARKSSLLDHERTHVGDKPHSCDACPRRFFRKTDLNQHRRTHTGDKPYACDECERRFAHKTSLVNHRRTHAADRPHRCATCRRGFNQRGNLLRHERLHAGVV